MQPSAFQKLLAQKEQNTMSVQTPTAVGAESNRQSPTGCGEV